jgi:hypothetical protein
VKRKTANPYDLDRLLPPSGRSFAYCTFKERIPNILVKSLDFLHRSWSKFAKHQRPNLTSTQLAQYEEECKTITAELSKLRYEIMTNKALLPLQDSLADCARWNDRLEEVAGQMQCEPTYFDGPMLFTECYVYRRLNSFISNHKLFVTFDPFLEQKRASLHDSMESTQLLADHLFDVLPHSAQSTVDVRQECINFLELCLWGNKSDLSLSGGEKVAQSSQLFQDLLVNRSKILCNDSEQIWTFFERWRQNPDQARRLDLILDNAGFELICDLIFLLMLYQTGIMSHEKTTVRFFVKQMPWFVSDTMEHDIQYTIKYLCAQTDRPSVRKLGEFVRNKFDQNRWQIVSEPYWTHPYDYSRMRETDAKLYQDLSTSDLLLFKGDLNYRKLVGDIDWPFTTTFEAALRGFTPSNMISLRTIKFNPVVNLPSEESVANLPSDWYFTGEYALIHFLSKKG